MPRRSANSGNNRKASRSLSTRQQEAKVRGFAALNRVRKGESKTLSAAARAEGTTVRSIRELLPAALFQGRPGSRIRVKAGDPYSARVEITTTSGPMVVNARGSRQRELAGRHRAVLIKVQRVLLPPTALEEFRGVKVGGQELLSDADRAFVLVHADVLGQLEALYVSPETRG